MHQSSISSEGVVEMVFEYEDGSSETIYQRTYNTILSTGKAAVARSLAGEIGSSFTNYVCKMQFGTNGTLSGVPRYVDAGRNGLFGPNLISKNVTAVIDPDNPATVIFTAILTPGDAVGNTITEMALQMVNGDLYSMVTMGGFTKSGSMQVTLNWRITYL